jgi:hypothetical protein
MDPIENIQPNPTPEPSNNQPPSPPPPQEKPVVRLADEDIKRLAGALQPQQQQPQYSEEQLRQLLKVADVTEDEIAAAFAIDKSQHGPQLKQTAEFFKSLIGRVVDHVNTLNNLRLQLILEQQLAPLQSFYQQVQNERYEKEFFEQNPDIPQDLARVVYRDMLNRGVRFQSKEEAFKAIAEQSRAIIGRTSGPRMSGLTTSGRPAASTEQNQGSMANQVKALFGD